MGSLLCLSADQPVANSYTIQTVAGNNSVGDGGPALAALFSQTEGIAVDNRGNIYVADADNNRVRRIGSDGAISTVAGNGMAGFAGDGGPARSAQLNQPYGLAVDTTGNLYIADLGNARVRKVTLDGNIQTVAGGGNLAQGGTALGGSALNAQFAAPRNVAVGTDGTLYISDFGANIVYSVSPAGNLTILAGTGGAGFGGDGGSAVLAQLSAPAGVAAAADGSVYIADSGNNCIRRVFDNVIGTVFNVAGPTGVAVSGGSLYIAAGSYLGSLYTSYSGVSAALDLAVDASGNVFATSGQFVFEVTNLGDMNTIAGSGSGLYFSGDNGPANYARLHTPSGIAGDEQGNKYIADTANNRIRKITAAGVISTFAGTGAAGADGDNGPAILANLNSPQSVAVDAAGAVYIADTGNNKIRKITPDGNIATVLAGLNNPRYVTVDAAGAVYIADTGNDRVLRITTAGTISVLAQVLKPAAVMADAGGNIWISEPTRVSKIAASGAFSIVADGLQAPGGLALTPDGELLIAETGTNLIRSWTLSGGLATVAGTGLPGFSGDGTAATSAQLNSPSDLVVDANGVIWVADSGNNCVRTLTFSTSVAPQQVMGPALVNAASLVSGEIAPGEIVSIFGSGFDPNNTQLLFDGKRATIFYLGTGQINALAPVDLVPNTTAQISIVVDGAPRRYSG